MVYPEGVWYTYVDESDLDEIIESPSGRWQGRVPAQASGSGKKHHKPRRHRKHRMFFNLNFGCLRWFPIFPLLCLF